MCTGKSEYGGNKLKDVQVSFVRDIATVMIDARSVGILTVITDWLLILEASKNDLKNINTILIKADFQ